MITKDYPCKCGHDLKYHQYLSEGYICWPCVQDRTSINNYPICCKFTPDNLKYLEEKYNQQILDKYRRIS
jgi:hypothetical protein